MLIDAFSLSLSPSLEKKNLRILLSLSLSPARPLAHPALRRGRLVVERAFGADPHPFLGESGCFRAAGSPRSASSATAAAAFPLRGCRGLPSGVVVCHRLQPLLQEVD